MTTVEIPEGSGNRYRYDYDASTKGTVYKGPVGNSPGLSEEEFLRVIQQTIGGHEASASSVMGTPAKRGTYVEPDDDELGWDFNDEWDFVHDLSDDSERQTGTGLLIEKSGDTVTIIEWTEASGLIEEFEDPEATVIKQEARVDLSDLLDPEQPHLSPASYGEGRDYDDAFNTYKRIQKAKYYEQTDDVYRLEKELKDIIVEAAISWMGHWGGDEEFVTDVGD